MSAFVYNLVHSLTTREKAYFKRFTKLYGGDDSKNYLRLYEFLTQLESYDARILHDKFRDEAMGKHLSSELNYLQELILKSLINYTLDSTPYLKLQKTLLFIDVLIDKDFRKQALKILLKAKTLAYKQEDFTIILKLIQLEEEILFNEGILGFTRQLADLQLERNHIYKQIQNLNELRLLREQVRELQFSAMFINDKKQYPEIFNHPLIKNEHQVLSLTAKEHWFYIREFIHYITRNYKDGQKYSAEYLHFLETNPELFKKSKILSTLSNYLFFSALLGDSKTFSATLSKLVVLEKDQLLDQIYISYIKYVRQLELSYRTNDTNSFNALIDSTWQFVQENHIKMGATQINRTMLELSRAGIITQRFSDTIDWLNFWFTTGVLDYTLIHAKLFLLITHMELGWFDLINNEVESICKDLKRKQKYDELASVFIQFFRKVAKTPEQKGRLLIVLSKRLTPIRLDPDKNHAFEFFDFLKWTNAQIE